MEKIKNFIIKYHITDFAIIALIITIFSLLFSHHLAYLIMDRGREFLFPQEILNGNVPYKDIHMIYFPTVYYINAFVYKLLGVSINSLIISQTIICIGFAFVYFLLSRIFMEKKTSWLLLLLITSCCIFTKYDLFSFVVPYSYARADGIIIFTLCAFLIIKLFKTDNIAYLYSAALMSGLCFSFKFEFFIAYILLVLALLIYKRLRFLQYLKILLSALVFPLILLGTLIAQGVSINDILAAFDFGYKFARTPVMLMFLSETGMYPGMLGTKLEQIMSYTPILILIILLTFASLKLQLKFSQVWIFPLFVVLICLHFANKFWLAQCWLYLPVLILLISCFKFKEIFKDKPAFFLIVSALLCAQRDFFGHSLASYGNFSAPLLFLALYIIIIKFLPDFVYGIQTKKLLNCILIVLVGLYTVSLDANRAHTYFPIKSNKGTIYTNEHNYSIFSKTLLYINNNIDKDASILFLPEGQIFNYLTDRKVNLKCHMMDRLYHDAYGQEEARNKIASTDSDYIFIHEKINLKDFYRPFLYQKGESLAWDYIDKNYEIVEIIYNSEISNNTYALRDCIYIAKKREQH